MYLLYANQIRCITEDIRFMPYGESLSFMIYYSFSIHKTKEMIYNLISANNKTI